MNQSNETLLMRKPFRTVLPDARFAAACEGTPVGISGNVIPTYLKGVIPGMRETAIHADAAGSMVSTRQSARQKPMILRFINILSNLRY